jgi:NAD(P)-dependent dehydrogenase (short-subunit alcohol dehydrogenase family)
LRRGYSASFHILDVTSETSWSAIIVDVMKRHGRVDVLVNNAGILIRAPLEDFAVGDLDRVLAVNVRGTFLGCKAVIAAMRAASGGSIINISSISGNIANMTGMTAYCASKGAVRMLTKAAALDLSKYGIRVNSIHPGTIETPMALKFLADPDTRWEVLGTTIFQRAGLPREVSEVVAFLASDASSYMTGSEVAVDGGMGAT